MVVFEGIEEILKKISNFNECSRALVTLSSALGVLMAFFITLYITLKLIQVFRLYILNQYCCQRNFVKHYGQWAVVSGATDGIGQSMAKELARRGMSIIVIGRNEEKLMRTKDMLEQEPNAGDIETIRIDLSDSSLDNFKRIQTQIDPENRDIGVLINNAGTFPDKFVRYNNFDMDYLLEIVNVNVLATLHLTRMIMPGMVERGKGLVMNVSSLLGNIPGSYLSVYGPTKSFMNSFTEQLQTEYASHPLDIVLLMPGAVNTKLFRSVSTIERTSFLIPTPDDYAKSAINAISSGVSTYSGTMGHGLVNILSQLVYKLGLLSISFRVNIMLNARNSKLSPVPKRKRVQINAAGDVPPTNSAALNTK